MMLLLEAENEETQSVIISYWKNGEKNWWIERNVKIVIFIFDIFC